MRREEARVAGLERELLVALRLEHGGLRRLDDPVAGDRVLERRVRELHEDAVALAQLVDPGERRAVGRPVPRDVDELSLARHPRLQVAARAALERVGVGAVDDHLVQAEPRDPQPGDRVPSLQAPAPLDRAAGERLAHVDGGRCGAGRPSLLQLAVEALRQLTLVVVVQRRGERVFPPPDRERPGERADAGDDHQRAEDAEEPSHQRSTASRCSCGGLRRDASTRANARGPRDLTSGYAA